MKTFIKDIEPGIIWDGFLNSYSQVFFSNNKLLAGLLVLVSFFDVGAGLSGIISIFTAQATIILFNFNREHLRSGVYTYNVLMVGIALGFLYNFSFSIALLLIIISVLTLFITIWSAECLKKRGLPFLSIPFLLGIWILLLGASNFTKIQLVEKEAMSLTVWFPQIFEYVSNFVATLPLNNALHLYFRSVGAIFFQYNDLAGIIIAVGILLFSRIAFGLSIFGFSIGYIFYVFFEGDFSQLIYSYIGFNFILTSIALGGFFVVPSTKSYLMLLFTIPVIAMLISALHTIFLSMGLPMYSLPFNLVTLMFLAAMSTRSKTSGINLVTAQYFSPEKNHYNFKNVLKRFKGSTLYQITLPIIGEWRISQGHTGNITHRGDWQYAWDFDVVDEKGKTFAGNGSQVQDYYCYDLPVVSPADGYIIEILDGIEDNAISDVNLKENWGNTIVIKHDEYLYSKLSHLKKDSFVVKTGDYVQRGQKIGTCGSSGRSPEPHLHFQLQATPFIGSKTLKFPITYYLNRKNGSKKFNSFNFPVENDKVCNVQTTKTLTNAFGFVPGKTLVFSYNNESYPWEILATPTNKTYLYCKKTESYAYFINNGTEFYFTDFYGDKKSLLHHFYCGAHKVLLGYYDNLELTDSLMLEDSFPKLLKAIHDFTAPFFHYFSVNYKFRFEYCNDPQSANEITFSTILSAKFLKRTLKDTRYTFKIKDGKIDQFSINNNNLAQCIE